MKLTCFLIKGKENGVTILTMNRPEVNNAMNEESWDELGQIIDQIEQDNAVRAVIITGAGPKSFISGADIRTLQKKGPLQIIGGRAQKVLDKLEACTKPTIAAINGYAFGGGLEITLACDIRIASENARFGMPELSLGIIPGAGGTQRLTRIVGLGRAKEIILTGRTIRPEEAINIGLISSFVSQAKLIEEAERYAAMLIDKGPVALNLAKKAIRAAMSTDQESGMLIELLANSLLCGTKDKDEGLAAFFEKRTPQYKGE